MCSKGLHLFISLLFVSIKSLLHARHHPWSKDAAVKKTDAKTLKQFIAQHRVQMLITTPLHKWTTAN